MMAMKTGTFLVQVLLIAGFFSRVECLSSVATRVRQAIASPGVGSQEESHGIDVWKEFEPLRASELDDQYLVPFFQKRPKLIADRFWQVSRTLFRARRQWEETGGTDDSGTESSKAAKSIDETTHVNSVDKEGFTPAQLERAGDLCRAISSLGPVAVKIAQTLSQRPDLVGADAAKALKRLQTKTEPFDNQLAYQVLHESLDYWEGPIAPGIFWQSNSSLVNPDGPALFAEMTMDPVACASLGQVYKATTHDGKRVAVKVQRPDALSVLAKDAQCFRTVLKAKVTVDKLRSNLAPDAHTAPNSGTHDENEGFTEEQVRGGENAVGVVIDRVTKDIKKELDYRIEAENGKRFRKSLEFLGFVTTPTVVQATDRVLITEWVPGRHLNDLSSEEGLALTQMAVEACTASMVLTGFVHADPHEGNLMLHDDGRIVFLDFGLMSDVDDSNMEGFARGIQALLSENWSALTEAFVDIGFVTTPIMHRNGVKELWRVDPKFGLPELAQDLEAAMTSTAGGVSRFGALATVLNKRISPNWLVYTPPYVLLLIRTFLTLEGMAASIDPEFNIYEMAMPWAIKRSLSPSTEKGVDVFRSTLLTEENKIQWERLLELAGGMKNEHAVQETVSFQEEKPKKSGAAQKAAMKDATTALLGSSNGRALRRALKDLDSVDLMVKLSSADGRPLLEKVSQQLVKSAASKQSEPPALEDVSTSNKRPISKEGAELRTRQQKWKNKVMRVLLFHHLKSCLLRWGGFKASLRLAAVATRVHAKTLWQKWRPRRSSTTTSSPQRLA